MEMTGKADHSIYREWEFRGLYTEATGVSDNKNKDESASGINRDLMHFAVAHQRVLN